MKRITSHLYIWVLLAILAGRFLGVLDPLLGVKLKPLVMVSLRW